MACSLILNGLRERRYFLFIYVWQERKGTFANNMNLLDLDFLNSLLGLEPRIISIYMHVTRNLILVFRSRSQTWNGHLNLVFIFGKDQINCIFYETWLRIANCAQMIFFQIRRSHYPDSN